MPKWGSFLSLNTAVKVGAGAAAGYFGTVVVSSYTGSAEDPKAEMHEERREEREKKLNFEVQQRSNELDKREQSLKTQEEALLKREAALREERLAMQSMQASTVAVTEETAGAVAAKTVQVVEEPTDLKIEQRETVVPTEKSTEYVPKRPAVFDGRGNAPVVTNKPSTSGVEAQLLYFNDPSFATDRMPSTDGRDGLRRPLLSPTDPNARRFANLRPQHVVSVKTTPEGIVVEEGRTGAFSLSSETRLGTVSTASDSGAPKTDEKGDATVVTLHGHGPKPPFGGKGAVSEAERNAFDKEKQLFARQKEGFKRKRTEKEKELADKERALEDREAELELRGNAADLFNFEDRRMITSAVRVNIPSDAKKTDEPFAIRKNSENFYDMEEDFAEEDDKAKAYKIGRGSVLTIPAQKSGIPSKTFRWFGGLLWNKSGATTGKPFVMQSAGDFEINGVKAEGSVRSEDEYEEMLTKEQFEEFNRSLSGEAAAKDWKNTIETRHTDSFLVDGDAQKMLDAAAYELDTQDGLTIIPLGRHPGEKTLYIENDRFAISAKPKGKLLLEPRDGVTISAKERKPLESVHTNKIEVRDSKSNKKIYEVSKGDRFMISATKELETLKEELRELGERLKTVQTAQGKNAALNEKVSLLTEQWKKQTGEWKATKQKLEVLLAEEREKGETSAANEQEAKERVSELQRQIVNLKKEVASLKTDAHILEVQALEATAEKNAALEKAKTEREKSQRLTKANNRLQEQVEELKFELESDNEAHKANMQEFLDKAETEKRNMLKELRKAQKDYDGMRVWSQAAARERDVLVRERDILKQENDKLLKRLRTVNKEKSDLEDKNLQLVSRNEKLEDDASLRNNDLKRLNMELEAKSRFNNLEKSAGSIEITASKKPGSHIKIEKVSDLAVKPKSKAELVVENKDSIGVLPEEKAPYATERQDEKGMTIKAKPKPDLQPVTRDQFITENSQPDMATVGTQTPRLRPRPKKEKKDAETETEAEVGTELKVFPQTQITLQGVAKPEEAPKKIKITTKKVVRKTDVQKRKFGDLVSETASMGLPGSKQKKAVFVSKGDGVQFYIEGKKQPFGDLVKENLFFDLEAKKQKPVLEKTTETQFASEGVRKEQKEASVQAGSSLVLGIIKSGEVNVKKAKKIRTKESGTGMEAPEFEISETKTVSTEAKKVEKQNFGTQPETAEFSVENIDPLVFEGQGRSFDGLKTKQAGGLFVEKQTKPENKIQTVSNFEILRKEKPENIEETVDEIAITAPERSELEIVKQDNTAILVQRKGFGNEKLVVSNLGGVTAEAKKIEKQDIATEMEKPALTVAKPVPDLTVQAQPKAELVIEDKESIEVLPKEKAPYVPERQNKEGMTIEGQPKAETFGKLEKVSVEEKEVIGDGSKLKKAEEEIWKLEETLRQQKTGYVISEIEKQDELEANEEEEKQMEKKFLEEMQKAVDTKQIVLGLAKLFKHVAKRSKMAADEYSEAISGAGNTSKYKKRTIKSSGDLMSKNQQLFPLKNDKKLRQSICSDKFDNIASSLATYTKTACNRLVELYRPKDLPVQRPQKRKKKDNDEEKTAELRTKEEELLKLEKQLKMQEADLKARKMQVSDCEQRLKKQKKDFEEQKALLEKTLEANQKNLKEKEQRISEQSDMLIKKDRECYDLKLQVRNLKLEISKGKLEAERQQNLAKQREQEIAELRKKIESAERDKKTIENLRADFEKSKKAYDVLKSLYDPLKEKHEQQTQNNQTATESTVSYKAYEKLWGEKREIEKKYEGLKRNYDQLLNTKRKVVDDLNKAHRDTEAWREYYEEQRGISEGILREKRYVTSRLNTQKDIIREEVSKELTAGRNRGKNYDNDDFGEPFDWSGSNILPNFNDFKASVVKNFKESVRVTTKNEEKLLNAFVDTLDVVWNNFTDNNVNKNLYIGGAFNDSEEEELKSFIANGKTENNFNPSLNSNQQNKKNTIYSGRRDVTIKGKSKTNVTTGNGKK